MSKKTRKEKILAAYRKKIRILEQSKLETSPSAVSKTIIETKIEKPVITQKAKQISPPKYFFLDLRKSIILSIIIIALEFGLYFAKLI